MGWTKRNKTKCTGLMTCQYRLLGFGGEEFEFVEGAGPVFAEEAGKGAVGEEFAIGLASGAVVGFVGCVTRWILAPQRGQGSL